VDYARKTRYSVGVVLEQRKTERGNNCKDLLRLARNQFALETADAVNIVFANSCRWPRQCDLSAIANRLKDTTKPGV
jgi:hypothetical protein